MINFKNIIDSSNPEKVKSIITIEGSPVWDYKASGFTVLLISEDPWSGVEDEYVTLEELKKYIVDCEIPFELVEFKTEADRELIKSYKWIENQLHFSHY